MPVIGPFPCPFCGVGIEFDTERLQSGHLEPTCEWYDNPEYDSLAVLTAVRKAAGLPSPHPEDWS